MKGNRDMLDRIMPYYTHNHISVIQLEICYYVPVHEISFCCSISHIANHQNMLTLNFTQLSLLISAEDRSKHPMFKK